MHNVILNDLMHPYNVDVYFQSAEDGRNVEDLSCAHPFKVWGRVLSEENLWGVFYLFSWHHGCIDFPVKPL